MHFTRKVNYNNDHFLFLFYILYLIHAQTDLKLKYMRVLLLFVSTCTGFKRFFEALQNLKSSFFYFCYIV